MQSLIYLNKFIIFQFRVLHYHSCHLEFRLVILASSAHHHDDSTPPLLFMHVETQTNERAANEQTNKIINYNVRQHKMKFIFPATQVSQSTASASTRWDGDGESWKTSMKCEVISGISEASVLLWNLLKCLKSTLKVSESFDRDSNASSLWLIRALANWRMSLATSVVGANWQNWV